MFVQYTEGDEDVALHTLVEKIDQVDAGAARPVLDRNWH